MRVIFLVDNASNVDMFAPVIEELPDRDVLFINTDKWSKRSEIEQKLQELGTDYITIGSRSRHNVNNILQQEQPEVVVLACDMSSPLHRLFIDCVNSHGIPTLLVMHGILTPWLHTPEAQRRKGTHIWIKYLKLLRLWAPGRVQPGGFSWRRLVETAWFWLRYGLKYGRVLPAHGYGGCSKIAVFGNATKQVLVSGGVSPKRIVVTGNTKFDCLFRTKGEDYKSKACQRWGISDGKDIVLLLTDYFVESGEWTVEQRKQFITAICGAVLQLPRHKLIIKLHPLWESEADYREITKELAEPPIICKDVPLWELLHVCSLAITVASTAGLEAMAIGKPLVVANLFNDETPFSEGSGAIIVRRAEDLLPALETALYQGLTGEMKEAATKFVYEQAYLQDGKAAKRIAGLIVSMARRGFREA